MGPRLRQLVAMVGALALIAPAAAAEEVDPQSWELARQYFENGQILYEEGHYEQAIVAWNEAWRLTQHPDLLYNIAGAWEKLARYKEALEVLDQYRIYAPPDERETIDRRIRSLQERWDAQVLLEQQQQQQQQVVQTKPPQRHSLVVPATLLAAGGVGMGTGGLFFGLAAQARSDLTAQCVEIDSGRFLCPAAADATASSHQRDRLVGLGAFATGGALVAAGVLWLVVDDPPQVTVGVLAGDRTGVTLEGRF